MGYTILVVEYEKKVAEEIEAYLRGLAYSIIHCETANEAYKRVSHGDIDLVIMDIFLEEHYGIEIAHKIKTEKHIPIIFLTTDIDEATIDKAVNIQPAAYLAKPFNCKELQVAIKIGLHYLSPSETMLRGDMVFDDEFSFDTATSQLICCQTVISLTKKEKLLFQLFMENKNTLVSLESIEYEIWPDKPDSATRRRSLLSRLRAKLKHKFISTEVGEGYIFRV